MQRIASFLSATAVSGLLVIVPLAILFLAVVEIYDLLEETAAFARLELPFPSAVNALIYIAMVVAAVFTVCVLVGLVMLTGPGQRFARFVEKGIADRIPLLGLVRNLTLNITGASDGKLQAVEVDLQASGTAVLGFLMETLDDGREVVFVPGAPAVTLGSVYLVPPERVRRLDASVASVAGVVSQWGLGAGELTGAASRGE